MAVLRLAGHLAFKRIPCNALTTKWLGKVCFVKGTLIHTKNGLIPIEEIKAGDEVLSYNEKSKQTEYKSVIETYIRQTEAIIKLQIEGEANTIETTPEHPFYVRIHKARDSLPDDNDGEWKNAGNLQIGDEVLSASGEWQKVERAERQAKRETVYNFAVGDNHNCFVGQNGTLVHNTCAGKHHPLPKYLGGDKIQDLIHLSADKHTAFHGMLRNAWKNLGFPSEGGINGSYSMWRQFMSANPGAQKQAFDEVLNAARRLGN